MAYKIGDFTNTDPASGAYPDGDVRNNTGSGNGTPVNRLTMADIWQFFHKLMRLTSTVPNSLPENETNGFQFVTALSTFVGNIVTVAFNFIHATTSVFGTVKLADQTEVNTGTEATKVLTPATLKTTLGSWTTRNNIADVTVSGGTVNAVVSSVIRYKIDELTKTMTMYYTFQCSNSTAPSSFKLLIPGSRTYNGALDYNDNCVLKDGATQKLALAYFDTGDRTKIQFAAVAALTNGSNTTISGQLTFEVN